MLEQGLITKLINGVPDDYEEIRFQLLEFKPNGPILAIFDDCRGSFASIEPLFTVGSHHLQTSTIVLSQQIFEAGPHLRVMSNNSTYHVLMRSLRNGRSVSTLAHQISANPHEASFIVKAWRSATTTPFSYIILDLHTQQSDCVRIRSRIFSHEG